jgi:hypothetical protein
MKGLYHLCLATAASAALVNCGKGGSSCGPGTHPLNGVCLAQTDCAPGTVLMHGQCVLDGSIECAQGTVFNPATSHCDVGPSACAPGTMLVGGVCVAQTDCGPGTVRMGADCALAADDK